MNSHRCLCVQRIEPQWKERKKRQHQESKSKTTKPWTIERNEMDDRGHVSVVCVCIARLLCSVHSFRSVLVSRMRWLCINLWTPVTRFYTKIIVRCTVCLSLSISMDFFFSFCIETEAAVIFQRCIQLNWLSNNPMFFVRFTLTRVSLSISLYELNFFGHI